MSNRDPHEPSLDEIFDQEARELFERLDHEARRAPGSERERRTALATLHTLKGSARAVERFELARRAHELEAEIQPLSAGPVAHEAIDRARAELEHLLLGGVRPALRDAQPEPGPEGERDADGVVTRLSEPRSDRLMELASEVATSQSRLATDLERLRDSNRELELAARRWRTLPAAAALLETVAARELLDDLAAVRTAMADALRDVDAERRRGASAGRALQQDLVRARLTRFGGARERFERVLRDAARTTGTRCELELTGGDTTLDRALHRELLAPLEHLLRNAAVHGIETPDVRLAAGKAATGRVRLACGIDGIDLVVDVTDDGRGLDPVTARATSNATLLDTLCSSSAGARR